MASHAARPWSEERSEQRDEVHHRTRCVLADGRAVPATVVNVSPHGLMARCEHAIAVGDRITVALPLAGPAAAIVRWSLGGRIGCQLDRAIGDEDYRRMLPAMRR